MQETRLTLDVKIFNYCFYSNNVNRCVGNIELHLA